MVQGEINRGRHTDHPAGRHSIRTNQCPPPPSRMSINICMYVLNCDICFFCNDRYLCGDRSNMSSRHSRPVSLLSSADCSKFPSPQPARPFVFQLPNFMYGLSHSYTDACFNEVSSAIKKVSYVVRLHHSTT